jgi:hypothetical protein
MSEEFVSPEMCRLRQEVLRVEIAALKERNENMETRMERIEAAIEEVRNLQKTILYAIISLAILGFCTLLGVLVGRGIDLGWFVP